MDDNRVVFENPKQLIHDGSNDVNLQTAMSVPGSQRCNPSDRAVERQGNQYTQSHMRTGHYSQPQMMTSVSDPHYKATAEISGQERPAKSRSKPDRDGSRSLTFKGKSFPDTLRRDGSREYKSRDNSGFSKTLGRMLGFPGSYPEGERSDDFYDTTVPHGPRGGIHDRDPRSRWDDENGLHQEIDALRQENALLRANLNREQDKNARFLQSADRMQKTMDNKELFLGTQATDDEIQGEFRAFLSLIRSWSAKLEGGACLTAKELEKPLVDEFELVAPGCLAKDSQFWKTGKKTRALIRGWVGHVIAKTVFRARSDIPNVNTDALDRWMGSTVQNAVATLEDRLTNALFTSPPTIKMRSLQDWRALTIELFSRIEIGQEPPRKTREFVESKATQMMHVIERFAPKEKQIEVFEGLKDILWKAIQLSRVLRRQRAFWWVTGPIPQQTVESVGVAPNWAVFNSTWMVDDNADEEDLPHAGQTFVELHLAPGLLKRGDIDGEHYEHTTCVVPIAVTCHLLGNPRK